MQKAKLISISTLAVSLVLLAGCSTPTSNVNTSNTNTTTNTNVNENTNVVVDENTNTEVSDEVDASYWLTYTNDEYGFSFKYPADWTITEKGSSVSVYSSGKSAELEVDPMTSADLYLSIDSTSTTSIKDLYTDKTNYRLVEDSEDVVIVAYDQTNEFADSVNTYYYIQSPDGSTILSATFFKNSLQSSTIVGIIQKISLNT